MSIQHLSGGLHEVDLPTSIVFERCGASAGIGSVSISLQACCATAVVSDQHCGTRLLGDLLEDRHQGRHGSGMVFVFEVELAQGVHDEQPSALVHRCERVSVLGRCQIGCQQIDPPGTGHRVQQQVLLQALQELGPAQVLWQHMALVQGPHDGMYTVPQHVDVLFSGHKNDFLWGRGQTVERRWSEQRVVVPQSGGQQHRDLQLEHGFAHAAWADDGTDAACRQAWQNEVNRWRRIVEDVGDVHRRPEHGRELRISHCELLSGRSRPARRPHRWHASAANGCPAAAAWAGPHQGFGGCPCGWSQGCAPEWPRARRA